MPVFGVLVTCILAILMIPSNAEEDCRRELGLKSGAIKDQQISASSSYGPRWAAQYARIGNQLAWRPAIRHRHEWLAVDLGKPMNITGVLTQGHFSWESPRRPYYLKRFTLEYMNEYRNAWIRYKIAGKDVEFEGNNDTQTIVTNILPEPVLATAVSVRPTGWHSNGFALRAEILGCSLSDIRCGPPPQIPGAAISHEGVYDVTYTCIPGFTSSSYSFLLTCSTDGVWEGEQQNCTAMTSSTKSPGPVASTVLPFPAKTTDAAYRTQATTVHDSAGQVGFHGATTNEDTITTVAGAILGCVVLLIIVLVGVLLYRRRKIIRTLESEDHQQNDIAISYSRVLEESATDQLEEENLVCNDLYESGAGRGGCKEDVNISSEVTGAAQYACIVEQEGDNDMKCINETRKLDCDL